jgi:ferritin-like metal-binding protein YciE
MSTPIEEQLVKSLQEAHALEEQAIKLLDKGATIAGDDEIGAIYRAHLLQTKEHERYVAERLQAHDAKPSRVRDAALQGGALGIGLALQAAPDTPARLATAAFAFENLEIATYRLLRGLSERAGDDETTAVVERILEQEEAAAELVAGSFERALEHTLGEPAESRLPGVTPIGKPSERPPEESVTPHPGPQAARQA